MSGRGAEKDAGREHEFSLPEQRHRLSVMFGGRSQYHVFHDSTLPTSTWPDRWTRRAVDRRTLCGSLSYLLTGVDAADWPVERQPIDVKRATCIRCLARYARVFPPAKTEPTS